MRLFQNLFDYAQYTLSLDPYSLLRTETCPPARLAEMWVIPLRVGRYRCDLPCRVDRKLHRWEVLVSKKIIQISDAYCSLKLRHFFPSARWDRM